MPLLTTSAAGTRLLCHNLQTSIEIGEQVLALATQVPERAQGPLAAQTASYDGRYGSLTDELRRYEMLFLAKIVRANHWFALLRKVDPKLKKEIKAFALATRGAGEILHKLQIENPHLTDVAGLAAEIELEEPAPPSDFDLETAVKTLKGNYLIGGRIDVAELMLSFRTIQDLIGKRRGGPAHDQVKKAA